MEVYVVTQACDTLYALRDGVSLYLSVKGHNSAARAHA